MLERNFKTKYQKRWKERGFVIVQNVAGAGTPKGFPDTTVISPFGETFYIEWKISRTARRQPLQEYWIDRLTKMKQKAWFVYPENIGEIDSEIIRKPDKLP